RGFRTIARSSTATSTLSLHDALPIFARNMGKSMRIFKSEVEELRGEDRGSEDGEDEDERPACSDRPREGRRDDREYDPRDDQERSEEHTSELQSRFDLVCRLLLEKKQ